MSYNKKKLATHLNVILENTTSDSNKLDRESPHSILGGAGSKFDIKGVNGRHLVCQLPDEGPPTLYILEQGLIAQNEFVNECLKDREFASKIGEKALTKRLQKVLKKFHPKPPSELNLDDIVKQDILQALRSEVKPWCVRVPITNLRIASQLKIGNVTFVRHEEGIVANTKTVMDF